MNKLKGLLSFSEALISAKPGILPRPGGPYPVGTQCLILTDNSRTDLLGVEGPRKIPLQIWYPAQSGNAPFATFLESKDAAKAFAHALGLPSLLNFMAKVNTNSYKNAVPLKDALDKVVFFHHGYGSFPGQNTIQAECLASHGYSVFSIGHWGEGFWPPQPKYTGGTEAMKAALSHTQNRSDTAQSMRYLVTHCPEMTESAVIWAQDQRYVMNWLENASWADQLDLQKVGTFGHSFGGAAAAEFSLQDSRCACFINLDGAFFCHLSSGQTKTPFLLITADNQVAAGLSPLQMGYIHLTIPTASHLDFCDMPLVWPSSKKSGLMGNVDSLSMQKLMNDWILAFMDAQLKDIPLPGDLLTRYASMAKVSQKGAYTGYEGD